MSGQVSADVQQALGDVFRMIAPLNEIAKGDHDGKISGISLTTEEIRSAMTGEPPRDPLKRQLYAAAESAFPEPKYETIVPVAPVQQAPQPARQTAPQRQTRIKIEEEFDAPRQKVFIKGKMSKTKPKKDDAEMLDLEEPPIEIDLEELKEVALQLNRLSKRLYSIATGK